MGYETINTNNVASIVVYEKDEAAMLEVDLLKSFILELGRENSVFMQALSENISHKAPYERRFWLWMDHDHTMKNLMSTYLVQQEKSLRNRIYDYS